MRYVSAWVEQSQCVLRSLPDAMLVIVLCHAFTMASTLERPFEITQLTVPEFVPIGQTVDIECQYNASFTVLDWYKHVIEFFRYKPGSTPETRSSPIFGVGTMEVLTCGPTVCRLRLGNLTTEASGMYRCDIEREVPPYKFATRAAFMTVYEQDNITPVLEGLAAEYRENDTIEAYCRGAPGLELRWYINGQEHTEMRGSTSLKKLCMRDIFLGSPPIITVQCAEYRLHKVYASKKLEARWSEEQKNYTVIPRNGSIGNLCNFSLFILCLLWFSINTHVEFRL